MSIHKKDTANELVTLKVRKHVRKEIVRLQSLLALAEGKRYSQSDIIEYALSCIPRIEIPLPDNVEVVMPEKKR